MKLKKLPFNYPPPSSFVGHVGNISVNSSPRYRFFFVVYYFLKTILVREVKAAAAVASRGDADVVVNDRAKQLEARLTFFTKSLV